MNLDYTLEFSLHNTYMLGIPLSKMVRKLLVRVVSQMPSFSSSSSLHVQERGFDFQESGGSESACALQEVVSLSQKKQST